MTIHLREINPIQWVMMAAFLLFCWFVIFGNQGLYTYYSLTSTKNALIAESQELKLRADQLRREEKLLHDPRYLETIIRQEMGYIRPGEIVFQMEK